MQGTGKIKKIKCFQSLIKEKLWLEEMALSGWFLTDVHMGCIYDFKQGEPRRMMYEIDRFNLPKHPSLKDIRHKEIFLDMAREMGWQVVAHDEALDYYFCKEYAPDEINELYNDEESRKLHAEKFKRLMEFKASQLSGVLLFVDVVGLLFGIEIYVIQEGVLSYLWFLFFVAVYTIVCLCMIRWFQRTGDLYINELCQTREEWEEFHDKSRRRWVYRLVLTNRGLQRFLTRMAADGWMLQDMSVIKYTFQKQDATDYIYTMDTKYLTNKRKRAAGGKAFSDSKDWIGMNNDWQIESVKDAEAKGWQFVCALETRAVIYKSMKQKNAEPLNDPKYDNSLRFVSIIGWYGLVMLISGTVGGVIGYFWEFFSQL